MGKRVESSEAAGAHGVVAREKDVILLSKVHCLSAIHNQDDFIHRVMYGILAFMLNDTSAVKAVDPMDPAS
jgi:hypothetical protein